MYRWICKQIDADIPSLGCGAAGPETSALKKLLRNPPASFAPIPSWDKQCVAQTISAVVNGQWPQVKRERAFESVTDKRCQLCYEQVGTLEHRNFCTFVGRVVGPCKPDDDVRRYVGNMTADKRRILLTRGLIATPVLLPTSTGCLSAL